MIPPTRAAASMTTQTAGCGCSASIGHCCCNGSETALSCALTAPSGELLRRAPCSLDEPAGDAVSGLSLHTLPVLAVVDEPEWRAALSAPRITDPLAPHVNPPDKIPLV